MKILYLSTNSSLTEKYQQILASKWTSETMRESLELADSFLNTCKSPLGFSKFIQSNENSELPDFFKSSHFTNTLKDQSALFNDKKLPSIPEKIPKRRSLSKKEYSRQTFEVIYDLIFPVFASYKNGENLILKGDVGFLRDIQSLIIILTPDFILPLLHKNRLKEETDFLNLTMFTYSRMTWQDNPAHQYQLFSIVYDNMGFHEDVIKCLDAAFKLTSPEDHDYLTKAQAYWAALIEAGKFGEAKEFSLRLIRNSSEKHFDEIKEIIELSFKLEHR